MRGDAVLPPATRRTGAQGGVPGPANPLADLRPMGVGAVLDGGFELLRFRFGRLMALSACLFVPIWFLNLVLAIVAPPAPGSSLGADLVGTSLSSGSSSPLAHVATGLQLVALSLLGLCVGHLAMALARGEDAGLRELGALAWRRWWVALLIVPLTAAVHGATACLGGIGWMLGDAFVFLSSVAAGAERLGPWRAFVRSWTLTRSEYGRALGISFGGLCITQVIRWSLSAGPAALTMSLDPTSPLVGVFSALSTAVLLLTEPLTACIAARAYLDLRCRRDGWDLGQRHERLASVAPGEHA